MKYHNIERFFWKKNYSNIIIHMYLINRLHLFAHFRGSQNVNELDWLKMMVVQLEVQIVLVDVQLFQIHLSKDISIYHYNCRTISQLCFPDLMFHKHTPHWHRQVFRNANLWILMAQFFASILEVSNRKFHSDSKNKQIVLSTTVVATRPNIIVLETCLCIKMELAQKYANKRKYNHYETWSKWATNE